MYNGENSMVLFNGQYDHCGSREAEYYSNEEELTPCNWCSEPYHEDEMIKREEDGERYCHEDCISEIEAYEKENYE
jgi:hypothetical protein